MSFSTIRTLWTFYFNSVHSGIWFFGNWSFMKKVSICSLYTADDWFRVIPDTWLHLCHLWCSFCRHFHIQNNFWPMHFNLYLLKLVQELWLKEWIIIPLPTSECVMSYPSREYNVKTVNAHYHKTSSNHPCTTLLNKTCTFLLRMQ